MKRIIQAPLQDSHGRRLRKRCPCLSQRLRLDWDLRNLNLRRPDVGASLPFSLKRLGGWSPLRHLCMGDTPLISPHVRWVVHPLWHPKSDVVPLSSRSFPLLVTVKSTKTGDCYGE